jgi:hypothetical protein
VAAREVDGVESIWGAPAQCRLIGERLRENAWERREYGVLLGGQPPLAPRRLADYYFFLCALLFDFRGFDIVLDGRELSGADAFFTLARRRVEREPEFFTAARLQGVTPADLDAVFSAGDVCLRRNDERAAVLRDAASRLLRDFAGDSANLLAATGGRLRHASGSGLMDRLEAFAGYADPHFKKGFVLVKTLEGLGAWRAEDREHLFIPVDYHLLRVALRAGMVEVEPALAEALRRKEPAGEQLDAALRGAVKTAYKQVEQASGIDIFTLDELFWTLGRSCCHYGRPPRCHACDFTHCSVMRSFNYECPGRCPLSGVCRGSLDPDYAALYETQLTTIYY